MSESLETTEHAKRVQSAYQWMHILVDFAAAFLFVVGSALLFYPSQDLAATWCFLIGSIFFAFKPTIRLVGHLHLSRLVGALERDIVRVANRV